MNQKTEKLLRTIFGDAQLIDVDFSIWDRYVSILVLADHISSAYDVSRKPIFKISFWKTTSIRFDFFHHENYIYGDEDTKHYCWNVDKIDVKKTTYGYSVKLYQSNYQPIIYVEFNRIEIIEVPQNVIDVISPNWYKPYSPFARRDVETLFKEFDSK